MRILTEPDASLCRQYKALFATENLHLEFTRDGIARIADIACAINEGGENIGARRLHTVMEKLLEALSFIAPGLEGQHIIIDADYVNLHIGRLVADDNLAKYIL